MKINSERAVLKTQEREMFEYNEPAKPEKVRLALLIRSKICQMLRIQR
ncbi:MAG: hypothetical protein PHW73_01330 [Atribacterota bacterium]|nr:hypothetical protein [Atribacterota bacterium]